MATQSWENTLRRILFLTIGTGIFLILLMPLIVTGFPPGGAGDLDGFTQAFGVNVFQRVFSGGFATYFPFIVGKAIYTRIIIEVIVGLWLVLAFRFPEFRPQRSWVMAMFALLVGASLIAALFGVSPTRSMWSTYERMQGVVDLLHWFAFALVVATTVRTFRYWRWLWHVNLIITLIVALVGIGQYFGVQFTTYLLYTPRIESTLGNPVYVGAIMMVNILIAAGLYSSTWEQETVPKAEKPSGSRSRRRRSMRASGYQQTGQDLTQIAWRAFYLFAIAICVWALFLAGARGALFGLVAGLIAFSTAYLLCGKIGWIRMAGVVGVVAILVVTVLLAVGLNSGPVQRLAAVIPIVREITYFTSDESSVSPRWASVKMGLQGFTQKPITGWGPENFTVAFDRNVSATSFSMGVESFDQAHSKPVEVLTTTGVLGFLPWAAMWLYIFWVLIKMIRNNKNMPLQRFIMFVGAAVVAYFVQNLFLFDTPATGLQLYLLLAFVVSIEVRLHKAAEFSNVGIQSGSEPSPQFKRTGQSSQPPGLRHQEAELKVGMWDRLRVWLDRMDMPIGVELGPVVALIIFSIVFLNARPFNAAAIVLDTTRPLTVEQALVTFDAAIESFPQLGNEIRWLEFDVLAQNWHQLNTAQRKIALATVEREFERAKQSEPEQWRIYVAAAMVFQNVALFDPDSDYLERARSQLEKAKELAPDRLEIARILTQQHLLEFDHDGAEQIICDYTAKSPRSNVRFQDLIRMIKSQRPEGYEITDEALKLEC